MLTMLSAAPNIVAVAMATWYGRYSIVIRIATIAEPPEVPMSEAKVASPRATKNKTRSQMGVPGVKSKNIDSKDIDSPAGTRSNGTLINPKYTMDAIIHRDIQQLGEDSPFIVMGIFMSK
jgi:hypothetical protein